MQIKLPIVVLRVQDDDDDDDEEEEDNYDDVLTRMRLRKMEIAMSGDTDKHDVG